MNTTKRKCGCTYRSNRAASVRHGVELGGYLVEPCEKHKQHAPDGAKCWCGQYHPTDADIGIDD